MKNELRHMGNSYLQGIPIKTIKNSRTDAQIRPNIVNSLFTNFDQSI